MTDTKKNGLTAEQLSIAHAAIATADLARLNIERYLQIHGSSAAQFNMKISEGAHYVMKIAEPGANYNMKIADDASAGIAKIVDDSAELAAKTLQAFLESRGKA